MKVLKTRILKSQASKQLKSKFCALILALDMKALFGRLENKLLYCSSLGMQA